MTSERMFHGVDRMAHCLIRRAARGAPDTLSERLEEEWLADLAERHGALSRLRFALGCCWATSVIAHEHGAVAVPAAGAPMGHGHFIGFAQTHSPLFSRRTTTFLLVACLHAAVLYGLIIGVKSTFHQLTPNPFVVQVDPPVPRNPPPLPPGPQFTHPPIFAPTPEVLPFEAEPRDGIRATLDEPRPPAPPSVPPVINRVQGGPGIGFPSTDDFYPSMAIYLREKGVATVMACVDGRGRLTSEPTIVQSAGSSRLDQGALKLAKAGSGHYRATTEDGRPVNSCYPFRIRFDLKN
jgi:TonB family protein